MGNSSHQSRQTNKSSLPREWGTILRKRLGRDWSNYQKTLRRCERSFSEKSVHAFRIAARRLAAQLDLLQSLAPAPVVQKGQRCIKRHLDTFDKLRDAQVQLGILQKECETIRGVESVRKLIGKRERRCRKLVEREVKEFKTRQLGQLVALLTTQLREAGKHPETRSLESRILMDVINRGFKSVVKCRESLNSAKISTIHRMRVAFKKFRYMVEAVQPLLPQIGRRRLEEMQAFQKLLGNVHDSDVFVARLEKLIRKRPIDPSTLADFRNWLLQRRARQLNLCLSRADAVYRFWPPCPEKKKKRPASSITAKPKRSPKASSVLRKTPAQTPPVSNDSSPPHAAGVTLQGKFDALNGSADQVAQAEPTETNSSSESTITPIDSNERSPSRGK